MTIVEAALAVLNEVKRPLHAREIATEIEQRGLYKFGAKDPSAVVSQALRKHTDSRFHKPLFEKTAPNTFALR